MKDSAPNARVCPKCGTEPGPYAPEGECPRCMLAAGLAVAASDPIAAFESKTQVGGQPAVPGFSPGSTRFGDYELLEEIGRGGMGEVRKARQVSLNRLVAIKLLPFSATTDPGCVKRFRVEASAAASLQHPNVVAIHEVGVHQGQHYFAMDLVEGPCLAEAVAGGPLPAQRAARYVRIVAEAIEYAHQRGILHRDLKPSNILIDPCDQPRVTDFGLAKQLEVDSSLTMSGQVLGSPSYMAPEQADPKRGKVGRRSDVYALGATLYHLITGRAPFVAATVAETLQQLQQTEPVSPTVLNPHVPRDLKTICLKCLEKEPARRYQTARELADDLGRWLRNEPIFARPIGPAGKACRWCRRKPLVATLTAGVAVALLLGLAGMAWQGHQARQARDLAQGRLYAAQMKLAQAAITEGKLGGALALLRGQDPAPGESDFRGFDWRYLYRLCLSSPSEALATNASGYLAVDCSRDGRVVAFGAGDGTVEIFDLDRRQRLKRWPAHAGPVDCLAFYPGNNNWLGTVSGEEGMLHLWDIGREPARLLSINTARGLFSDIAFSPSGQFLCTRATDAQSIDLWEFRTGAIGAKPALTLRTNLPYWGPAAFSSDGRMMAVCNRIRGNLVSFVVDLYDLVEGGVTSLPEMHADFVMAAAFAPDGHTLATGGADERLVLWDGSQRTNLWTQPSDFIAITSIGFTPDGRSLFASSYDQNLRSWRVEDPTQSQTWPGHSAGVSRLVIASHGRSLLSAGEDGTARLWNLSTPGSGSAFPSLQQSITLFSPQALPPAQRERISIFSIAVSPAQDRVAAAENHRLLLCDLGSGTVLTNLPSHDIFPGEKPGLGGLAFSPDGRHLAVGSDEGRVAILNAVTLTPLRPPLQLHSNQVTHLAYALNGSAILSGGGLGTGVKLTDWASGKVLTTFSAVEGTPPMQPVAVSRDGQRLATGGPDGRVRIWDIASHRLIASSPWKVRLVNDLAFSPDGKLLAIAGQPSPILLAGQPSPILLWDLSGQGAPRKLVGHAGLVNRLTFSPDGRTLASAGMDHTVRLWHLEIDQEVAILKGHTGWVWCVAFAEGGDALLSGGRDGTLKLWRALAFEQIAASEKAAHVQR